MLTVTDFVQMLNYCWNQTVPSNIDELKNIQIDDVDQITIQQWKGKFIYMKYQFFFNNVEQNRNL